MTGIRFPAGGSFFSPSSMYLDHIQPPSQSGQGVPSLGIQREADHLLPCSTEENNGEVCLHHPSLSKALSKYFTPHLLLRYPSRWATRSNLGIHILCLSPVTCPDYGNLFILTIQMSCASHKPSRDIISTVLLPCFMSPGSKYFSRHCFLIFWFWPTLSD
jgi:hypothetical protein